MLRPQTDSHHDWIPLGRRSRASVEFIFGLVLLATLPSASFSEENREDDERAHWAISGAFELGVFGHTGKGNTSSTSITDNRFTTLEVVLDLNPEIVTPAASRQDVVTALIGGTFEVMAPEAWRGGPRFFFDLNLSEPRGSEVGLAREGDPTTVAIPENIRGGQLVGESTLEGRGTKITVQHQGPQIHAGIGAAFTLDLFSTRLRIKPSLVYSRLKQDVYGVTRRGVRLETPIGSPERANCTGTQPSGTQGQPLPRDFDTCFRSIAVEDKIREIYHGIGPALEIEMDTGEKLGPLDITLYLKGHASRLFGDVTTNLAAVNTNPNRGTSNEVVFYKYSQDRWVFRAATGIRLRWVPRSMR